MVAALGDHLVDCVGLSRRKGVRDGQRYRLKRPCSRHAVDNPAPAQVVRAGAERARQPDDGLHRAQPAGCAELGACQRAGSCSVVDGVFGDKRARIVRLSRQQDVRATILVVGPYRAGRSRSRPGAASGAAPGAASGSGAAA